jgi:hypothetical protein
MSKREPQIMRFGGEFSLAREFQDGAALAGFEQTVAVLVEVAPVSSGPAPL